MKSFLGLAEAAKMEGQQRGRQKGRKRGIKIPIVYATAAHSIQKYASQKIYAFLHLLEMREQKAQSPLRFSDTCKVQT